MNLEPGTWVLPQRSESEGRLWTTAKVEKMSKKKKRGEKSREKKKKKRVGVGTGRKGRRRSREEEGEGGGVGVGERGEYWKEKGGIFFFFFLSCQLKKNEYLFKNNI